MNSIFQSASLPLLIGIFLTAGAVVWFAGTKLAIAANEMAEKTGIGSAFIGILVLGGITSIPEIVTTLTASIHDKPNFAASNLIGGIAMQVSLLVLADMFVRQHPISSLTSGVSIVFQGVACIFMLSIVILCIIFPVFSIFSVGGGSIFLFISFLAALKFSHGMGDKRLWTDPAQERAIKNDDTQKVNQKVGTFFSSKTGFSLIINAAIIVLAGYLVVLSVEAISEKTGLSENIGGFILVAITTSLPEISTVISSVRIQKYEMVFANIFGTNLFDAALLFVADIAYRGGSLFDELGEFAIAGSALGIIITSIFLAGLLNLEKKKFFRMGWDSILAIIIYFTGVYFLFGLK